MPSWKDWMRGKREELRYKFLMKHRAEALRALNSEVKLILFSSDCVGGRLMRDFRLPSYTPTVNIWYSAKDFLSLCEKPETCFSLPMTYGGRDEEGHHTGIIGDITVHFGHEEDYAVAEKKWKTGCRLFNRATRGEHEFCVVMNDRNGFVPEDLERFLKLPYRYKMLFSHRPYPQAGDAVFYMRGEDSLPFVDVMTGFEGPFSLRRRYDRFDFYRWFYEILSRTERQGDSYRDE